MRSVQGALIAKVHVGKRLLDLDDAAYRDVLERATGKRSCSAMTVAQLNAVLAEFRRLGADLAGSQASEKRPRDVDGRPLLRKVQALLADAKRPWSYAHSMAQRMYGADRCEWLPDAQLHALVAALQIDADRRAGRRKGSARMRNSEGDRG